VTGNPDPALQSELDALAARLDAARPFNIGFPAATDFDYRPLAPFFARYMLNNLGDPFTDGAYPMHTKQQEREVVSVIADLLHAPQHDRWGYVTAGASEGTEYALYLARRRHPGGIVYHSEAAHHCVANAVDRLGMDSIVVRVDGRGEVDYDDLATQVGRHRDRPVIVVANAGSAITEAVDDVRQITQVLDSLAIRRRFVHADAALSGIPLALVDATERPGFDFADGADSVVVSGHKFIGAPLPCAVVIVRASHHAHLAGTVTYTGSPDATVTNSRSGLAALVLWYALRRYGVHGLRKRAEQSRGLAAYTYARLRDIGWEAWLNEHAFTVVLAKPPAKVTERWVLAHSGDRCHIVCMPGVTHEQIDAFVDDLEDAATQPHPVAVPATTSRGNLLRRVRHPVPTVA
jgi:histidine decarboxylase